MKAKVRVEVYCTTPEDGYRWRVKHGNGKILAAASESFATKANAKRNLKNTRDALKQVSNAALKGA